MWKICQTVLYNRFTEHAPKKLPSVFFLLQLTFFAHPVLDWKYPFTYPPECPCNGWQCQWLLVPSQSEGSSQPEGGVGKGSLVFQVVQLPSKNPFPKTHCDIPAPLLALANRDINVFLHRDSKAVKVEDSSIRIECDCHP